MTDSRWGEGVSEHKTSARLHECIETEKKSMSASTASEELQHLHHAFCSLDWPGTHKRSAQGAGIKDMCLHTWHAHALIFIKHTQTFSFGLHNNLVMFINFHTVLPNLVLQLGSHYASIQNATAFLHAAAFWFIRTKAYTP